MRIDKFLKISRIMKRRVLAQEACDGGRVSVNGRDAKPSRDVAAGDTITVRSGGKTLTFRILSVPETPRFDPASLYEIVKEEKCSI